MKSPRIEEIIRELEPLKGRFEVVLHGSAITHSMRPTSDIDIAVITRERDKEKNKKIMKSLLGIAPNIYDIRVFELFPIYIQMSIIKDYKVIFGDEVEISWYFRQFRKKWEDCKHRILNNQFKSVEERLSSLKPF